MKASLGSALIALAGALASAGCDTAPDPQASSSAETASPPAPEVSASASEAFVAEAEASAVAAAEASPAAPSVVTYAPKDECAGRAGWTDFRKALGNAVSARDARAFAALASSDVALDYGGGSGTDELVKRLSDPASGLWQELDAILPLGCAVQGGLAAMPWIFWNVPENTESYETMLVLGQDTALRDRPGGKALAPAGWRLASIDTRRFDPKARAARVTLEDGAKGWIETAKLRSLLDYRLIAEPRDGGWRITAFIAGD